MFAAIGGAALGAYKMTPKSAPFKVFIELGGAKSIIHDENWDNFIDKGLVRG